ncbi:unnamed protein product [Caenorhabditis bovis]|uniref:Nondiscriminating glutamyl-tRNA synthetase EARS2, mitochondrial n=1 Tax=Caenorhabditis bovis TaxID=2654633 RepID=A0A8S1ES00_9PELO|nr:unnamed protein product [Caenorhabditis bovis]
MSFVGVRTRFAPSPTGHLHIGGLRTALFNYLFAKKHDGKFVLRIEDTDRARFVGDAQQKIYEALDMYGLKPDEGPREGGPFGPYEQSKRLGLYKEAAHQLIDSGHAYRCFCSEQRLELLRKDASRRGEIPKYDRKCASLDAKTSRKMAESGENHVIRLKLDKQTIAFDDEVFGHVTQLIDESDAVVLKSDGFPTYHLANVVDDRRMEITHVIRGMEWLSSTGKHHLLYKAFDWKPPRFVHLSLIMRTAAKKLSKRDRDAFVAYYGDVLGVLPDALLNLLVRNGSGIRDFDANRFYTLADLVADFDHTLLGRRNLLLDTDVLNKYARMAFKCADFETTLKPRILARIQNDLKLANDELPNDEYLRKIVDFLRTKEETFGNLSSLTRGDFVWFFTQPKSAEVLISQTTTIGNLREILDDLRNLDDWTIESIQKIARTHKISDSKMMAIIRISLIGSKKGPPISELVEFFGPSQCSQRISTMISHLSS